MAKLMIIMIKGPERTRGWLVPARDDEDGISARFVEDKDGTDAALRQALNVSPDGRLPVQIEVAVSRLYFNRLRGQVVWRE